MLTIAVPLQIYETSWLAFLIPLTAAVLLLYLPGLLIGFAGGLRRSELLGWAPVGSVAVIASAGIISPVVNMRWGLISTLIPLSVCMVGVLLCRKFIWRNSSRKELSADSQTEPDLMRGSVYNGVVVAIVFIVFFLAASRFASLVRIPGAFAQTWDNLFHLNVIQGIVGGATPSSLSISSSPLGGGGFYPAAWHDYASLIILATGAPVPTAEIAAGIVVAYLVWPLGIYTLTKIATNNRTAALLSIPLSGAFPQFPSNFLSYGTLYPNMLGVCLLPVLIAFVVKGLKLWNCTTWRYVFFVALGAYGIAFAQPNTAIGFILIAVLIFYAFHMHHVVEISSRYYVLKAIYTTLLWITVLLVFNFALDHIDKISVMRRGYEYWHAQGNIWQALLQLLSASGGRPQGNPTLISIMSMLPFGTLSLLGLYVLIIQKKEWWVASSYIGLAVLFIMSFALTGPLRVYIVGIWYSEVARVWALLMPFFPMLAAAGVCFLLQIVLLICNRKIAFRKKIYIDDLDMHLKKSKSSPIWLVSVCSVIAVTALFAPHMQGLINDTKGTYQISDTSFINKDEYSLFTWMRNNIPKNALVVANPWEGGSLAWAIGGCPSAYPTLNMVDNKDLIYLAQHLGDARNDSKVCQIIKKYNIRYALDLEDEYLWGGSGWEAEKQYPGFDNIADAGIGTVVKQFGEAKLVEIATCLN